MFRCCFPQEPLSIPPLNSSNLAKGKQGGWRPSYASVTGLVVSPHLQLKDLGDIWLFVVCLVIFSTERTKTWIQIGWKKLKNLWTMKWMGRNWGPANLAALHQPLVGMMELQLGWSRKTVEVWKKPWQCHGGAHSGSAKIKGRASVFKALKGHAYVVRAPLPLRYQDKQQLTHTSTTTVLTPTRYVVFLLL